MDSSHEDLLRTASLGQRGTELPLQLGIEAWEAADLWALVLNAQIKGLAKDPDRLRTCLLGAQRALITVSVARMLKQIPGPQMLFATSQPSKSVVTSS